MLFYAPYGIVELKSLALSILNLSTKTTTEALKAPRPVGTFS